MMKVEEFCVLTCVKVGLSHLKLFLELNSASRQEYITEIWREGDRWDTRDDYDEKDWIPENNNYQFDEHRRLFIHIREMHRHLYKVRAEVDKVCFLRE